jgi:hypothetical protein
MNFNLTNKNTTRQWRALIALDAKQFDILLEVFKQSYLTLQGSTLKSRLMNDKATYCINNERELLLFTLTSLKQSLTYDALGVMAGMDGSHAKKTQRLGLRILTHALCALKHMPARDIDNLDDFKAYFSDIEELIIDVTEQDIQRPSDKEIQKEFYSGKKKLTQ